jgi:hypothetical protein
MILALARASPSIVSLLTSGGQAPPYTRSAFVSDSLEVIPIWISPRIVVVRGVASGLLRSPAGTGG